MDKDPMGGAGFDAAQIDSLQNLDTARMALRWALERLRALEALNQDLSKKAEWEFRMRAKAEEDFKRQWESERSHWEDVLKKREAEYERDFAAKLGEWEKGYQALAGESRLKERQAAEAAQGRLSETERRLEDGLARKLEEVRALERDLEARKGAFDAQQREFQAYCALQKSGVEGERRKMRDEAAREAEGRVGAMEKALQERFSALGSAWRGEKEALAAQAGEWRRQAEEARLRAREAEARCEALELQARQSARDAGESREDAARRQVELYARETELHRAAEALRGEFEMKRAAIERLKRRALAELKRLAAHPPKAGSGAGGVET